MGTREHPCPTTDSIHAQLLAGKMSHLKGNQRSTQCMISWAESPKCDSRRQANEVSAAPGGPTQEFISLKGLNNGSLPTPCPAYPICRHPILCHLIFPGMGRYLCFSYVVYPACDLQQSRQRLRDFVQKSSLLLLHR